MSRSTTGIIVMVLLVAVGVLGVMLYQERQKTSGVEISVGGGKLEIEKK
jgi:preprotein translocase subunit SecG